MKRMLPELVASIVLLLLLLIASGLASADTFSRLYIFGDSLSDTGNAASVAGDLSPPYYKNRFSNGPVAVEVLAKRLHLNAAPSLYLLGPEVGTNYAVGGARARGQDSSAFTAQVTAFLANHNYRAPSDALYVVIIGGNDLSDATSEPTTEGAEKIVDATVAAVASNLQTLITAGARSFIVTDSSDIGLTPQIRLIAEAKGNRSLIQRATALSGKYALKLENYLHMLESETSVKIPGFSLFTFTHLLKTTAPLFGITNTRDACFYSQSQTFNPDCKGGAKVDKFAFFDEFHPTAKVHRLIGQAIFKVVEYAYPSQTNARLRALP